MANFIAPLSSAFNHEAKDPSSKFRYWRQCFSDFCEINSITDGQTLSKFFHSCVGRPTVSYLEVLPNYDQLTTVKLFLDTVENRYKKIVNLHTCREIKFSIYRHKSWRKSTRLRKSSKQFQ